MLSYYKKTLQTDARAYIWTSPFALNSEDTLINYCNKSKLNPYELTKHKYRDLVELTIPTFFEEKIKAISLKKSDNIKVFYRYVRVKKRFNDII